MVVTSRLPLRPLVFVTPAIRYQGCVQAYTTHLLLNSPSVLGRLVALGSFGASRSWGARGMGVGMECLRVRPVYIYIYIYEI